MAIEETFRREFQTRVADVLDEESARFLMAHLPPVPWPEVATKHDLELLRAGVDARFDQAKVSIDGRFSTLETSIDGRLATMESSIEGRFAIMDERMQHMSSKLQTALADQRADLSLLISNQTRTMIIALITAFVAISSLALFR